MGSPLPTDKGYYEYEKKQLRYPCGSKFGPMLGAWHPGGSFHPDLPVPLGGLRRHPVTLRLILLGGSAQLRTEFVTVRDELPTGLFFVYFSPGVVYYAYE